MVDTWESSLNEFMKLVINKQFTHPIGKAWVRNVKNNYQLPMRTIPEIIYAVSPNIDTFKEYLKVDFKKDYSVKWISPQKKKEFINLYK